VIIVKSPREIDLMRSAGAIVADVLDAVGEQCRVGVTTKELDELAESIIRERGATPSFKGYGGFPSAICASVNDTLIHGIPSSYRLKEGDLVKIDVGANYKGYHGDAARTFIVGFGSALARRLPKSPKRVSSKLSKSCDPASIYRTSAIRSKPMSKAAASRCRATTPDTASDAIFTKIPRFPTSARPTKGRYYAPA
jgi:methionyl aminopeptidase